MFAAVVKLLRAPGVALAFAALVVVGIFGTTLLWRLPLASEITLSGTEIVTAQLYSWLQNWIHEGAFSAHFMMMYDPLSIESPDFQHREELYRSFPPGSLLPPYLIALLTGSAPISLLTRYGLAGHLILTIAIVGTAFVVTERASRAFTGGSSLAASAAAALLAISAGSFMTLANGPSYFFARIYVFDTAVLPWVGLALLLDAVYTTNFNRPQIAKAALALQMVVFTFCLWTDQNFIVLGIAWIGVRWLERRLKIKSAVSAGRAMMVGTATFVSNVALIVAWRILAGSEEAGQFALVEEWSRTLSKFQARSAMSADAPTMAMITNRVDAYLKFYFAIDLQLLVFLLAASALCLVLAFLMSRKLGATEFFWPLTSVAMLASFPISFYFFALPQYDYFHDFPSAKLAIPIALLILTLTPAAVSVLLARASQLCWRLSPKACETAAALMICVVAVSGIYFSTTRYGVPQLRFPNVRGGIGIVGTIVGRNVEYADVVFSPQFEILRSSAESGFSRKLVYRTPDPDAELAKITADVCQPFNLVIVADETQQPRRATLPSEIWRDSGLFFYRWRGLMPVSAKCAAAPH
jgi:hypothetical protein